MKKTMKMSMKMSMKNMLSMAAAVLTATIMTACAGSDDTIADTPQLPENQSKTITLTTTVGLGGANGGATTRALTSGGVKTFAEGDQMAVIYKNMSGQTVKAVSEELKPEDITTTDEPLTDKKNATFTVTLDAPNSNAPIRYIYPAAMAKETVAMDASIDDAGTVDFTKLNAQDGTMGSLGSALDLCTFDAANWSSGELPVGATLANQLAVLAVTVKDDKATATTVDDELVTTSVTRLTVSDGTNKYTATGCDADDRIYLAVLPTDKADITVDIYTGNYATTGHHYVKALADKKSYAASNLYNVGWKINQKAEPMTMEATTGGTIVVNRPRSGMQYSVNGGAKTTMTETTTIDVSEGGKVEFYGDGTSITQYGSSTASNSTKIAGGSAEVKVYGNIMSLVDEFGFATATTLPAINTFGCLFLGNTKLKDASSLLLPATTLKSYCYQGMFDGCTSLTAAPALPAETLAECCYYGMFIVCTSLTTAPALPAKMLAKGCYQSMFRGCKKLSAVTCLAINISARDCTTNWLLGVSQNGTFTTPSSTRWSTGADGIPRDWTRVDAE